MLPPWFLAPLGARQVTRLLELRAATGEASTHLHMTQEDGQVVEPGHLVVITHASITLVSFNQDYTAYPYEQSCWFIRNRSTGQRVTPRMPLSWQASDNDVFNSSIGYTMNGSWSVPCAPILSPIVFTEGQRADVHVVNPASRADALGWVTGFTMPVVNDVPGTMRFFTEKLR